MWAGQQDRLERLRSAIDILRADPPELIAGDYLELLPVALAARDPESLTIVFNSASTAYLRSAEFKRLEAIFEDAAPRGPLAWVSLEAPRNRQERGNTDDPVGLGSVPRRPGVARRHARAPRTRRAPRARHAPVVITSATNPKLKLIKRLLDSRRQREKEGLFAVEGEDLVEAARAADIEPFELLFAGEDVEPDLLAAISTMGHPPRVIGVSGGRICRSARAARSRSRCGTSAIPETSGR